MLTRCSFFNRRNFPVLNPSPSSFKSSSVKPFAVSLKSISWLSYLKYWPPIVTPDMKLKNAFQVRFCLSMSYLLKCFCRWSTEWILSFKNPFLHQLRFRTWLNDTFKKHNLSQKWILRQHWWCRQRTTGDDWSSFKPSFGIDSSPAMCLPTRQRFKFSEWKRDTTPSRTLGTTPWHCCGELFWSP